MYPVSPCYQSCLVWLIGFLWPDEAGDEAVCDVLCPCSWDLVLWDEENCVHSCHSARHSLCQPSKLVAVRVGP